jgi:hypothetical protein
MTDRQRIFLMADLWPRACQTQGWSPNDRTARLREIGLALGRQIESANEIGTTQDFDRVKRHLQTLALNLRAAGETDADGRARRLRNKVIGYLAQIAPLIGQLEAERYVEAIIADKFNHGQPGRSLHDLSAVPQGKHPSELDQLVITISARADEMKIKHKIHATPL